MDETNRNSNEIVLKSEDSTEILSTEETNCLFCGKSTSEYGSLCHIHPECVFLAKEEKSKEAILPEQNECFLCKNSVNANKTNWRSFNLTKYGYSYSKLYNKNDIIQFGKPFCNDCNDQVKVQLKRGNVDELDEPFQSLFPTELMKTHPQCSTDLNGTLPLDVLKILFMKKPDNSSSSSSSKKQKTEKQSSTKVNINGWSEPMETLVFDKETGIEIAYVESKEVNKYDWKNILDDIKYYNAHLLLIDPENPTKIYSLYLGTNYWGLNIPLGTFFSDFSGRDKDLKSQYSRKELEQLCELNKFDRIIFKWRKWASQLCPIIAIRALKLIEKETDDCYYDTHDLSDRIYPTDWIDFYPGKVPVLDKVLYKVLHKKINHFSSL
jgi:hypothetical protein